MEQQRKKPQTHLNATAFAIVFLGICFVVSAVILGGRLGAINKTFEGKTFFSPASEHMTVDGGVGSRTYMNQAEAAEYLHVNVADIAKMLDEGQLTGFVKSSGGEYIIARASLDDWFSTHQSKPAKAAKAAE